MPSYEQVVAAMDEARAEAILKKAIELNAYEGDMPADVASRIKDANDLCKIAKTSYDSGIRGQAALEILKQAGIDLDADAPAAATPGVPPPAQATASDLVTLIGPDGSETQVSESAVATLEGAGFKRKVEDPPPAPASDKVLLVPPAGGDPQEFDATAAAALSGAGWKPYQPVAPAAPAIPPAAAAPAAAIPPPADDTASVPGAFDINSAIPGYDGLSAKDAAARLKAITDEETFNKVKAYESDHEDRKTVRNVAFTPPAAPAAAPPMTPSPTSPPPTQGPGSHSAYGDSSDMERAYNDGSGGQDVITANQLPEPGVGDLEIKVEIDTYTDQALAQLQTRYHNADVRSLNLLGQQEGLRDLASRMQSEATSAAYAKFLAEERAALGDKMTASGFDGASSRAKHRAESDEHVHKWANRVARHGAEVRNLKARQAAYEKGVARLSREQTRREKEKELGGARAS